MVHADRGIQYASYDFREMLSANHCIQSMSRRGNCWDNAEAESFFHTLKGQYTNHTNFTDRRSAELGLFKYIEAYYNHRRRYSRNGYKSPANYEKKMEAAA